MELTNPFQGYTVPNYKVEAVYVLNYDAAEDTRPAGRGARSEVPVVPRILIVEDDRELRQVLSYALMDMGATCEQAIDGTMALQVLCHSSGSKDQFDCVLLDILMPGGVSGWDVLEAMRANPLWSEIPAIVLSGKATLLAEQERAKRLGATHIQKTARFVDDVMAKVSELLGLETS